MSYGGIPISLLMDIARLDGVMYQQELDLQTLLAEEDEKLIMKINDQINLLTGKYFRNLWT